MVENDLNECRIVCIFSPTDAVLALCDQLGSSGYLFDGEHGLNLITTAADAAKIDDHFEARAFIRETTIRVKSLPEGIRRLTRKKPTASAGRIDGWNRGSSI